MKLLTLYDGWIREDVLQSEEARANGLFWRRVGLFRVPWLKLTITSALSVILFIILAMNILPESWIVPGGVVLLFAIVGFEEWKRHSYKTAFRSGAEDRGVFD